MDAHEEGITDRLDAHEKGIANRLDGIAHRLDAYQKGIAHRLDAHEEAAEKSNDIIIKILDDIKTMLYEHDSDLKRYNKWVKIVQDIKKNAQELKKLTQQISQWRQTFSL